ncbi:hypothetical protein D3C71_1472810 [compost metagenome]
MAERATTPAAGAVNTGSPIKRGLALGIEWVVMQAERLQSLAQAVQFLAQLANTVFPQVHMPTQDHVRRRRLQACVAQPNISKLVQAGQHRRAPQRVVAQVQHRQPPQAGQAPFTGDTHHDTVAGKVQTQQTRQSLEPHRYLLETIASEVQLDQVAET